MCTVPLILGFACPFSLYKPQKALWHQERPQGPMVWRRGVMCSSSSFAPGSIKLSFIFVLRYLSTHRRAPQIVGSGYRGSWCSRAILERLTPGSTRVLSFIVSHRYFCRSRMRQLRVGSRSDSCCERAWGWCGHGQVLSDDVCSVSSSLAAFSLGILLHLYWVWYSQGYPRSEGRAREQGSYRGGVP